MREGWQALPLGELCDVLDHIEDETVIARVRGQVTELCGRHPVYAA